MPNPIRVALLSRNAIVREGLRRILADEHFDVTQSVDHASHLNDINMQEDDKGSFLIVIDNGAGAEEIANVEDLQCKFPNARLVVMADEFNFDAMVQAFRFGVYGYFVKHIACESLVGSLQLIAMGEKVMPSELANALPFQTPVPHGDGNQKSMLAARLSDREIEILRCLIVGYPNKIVSRRMGISEATVKVHVKAILRKAMVQNRTQAAIWAVGQGLEGYSALSLVPVSDALPTLVRSNAFHASPIAA